ncbi:MAG: DNA repair protein RecO [Firmicutes bacterium]|nr:DNA repair protein RecO [Bacillota bacterium]
MNRSINTEGIVLKCSAFHETDRLLTLLLPDRKVAAIAHGANKSKSSLAAATQPLSRAQFLLYRGRQLYTVQQAAILSSAQRLAGKVGLFAIGEYLADLIDHLLEEGWEEPLEGEALFRLLAEALDALAEGKDPAMVARICEAQVLRWSGLMPLLTACVRCGTQEALEAFAPAEGGLLCHRCREQVPQALPVSREQLLHFSRLFLASASRLGRVHLNTATVAFLDTALTQLLQTQLKLALPSRTIAFQLLEKSR